MTKNQKLVNTVQNGKSEQIKAPVNVTAQKFDHWVYSLWVTCPTDYPVNEFYNMFRENLWAMYIAQKPAEDKTEAKP